MAKSMGNGVRRAWKNDEAADYIGCTPKTLRVWVSKKKVPHTRVNGLIRFFQKDLDSWLEKNRVQVG